MNAPLSVADAGALFSDFEDRYQPRQLADFVFAHRAIHQQLNDLVTGAVGFPADGLNGILLYGPPGTGKSALAKALPVLLQCADHTVTAINVSQGGDNGAAIMENIKAQVSVVPLGSRFHCVILDEADNLLPATMLSLKAAMNIARQYCVFLLTTNDVWAIDEAVRDRCVRIALNAAPPTAWVPRFQQVLRGYGVRDVSEADAAHVIACCGGSARRIMAAARSLVLAKLRKCPAATNHTKE